MALVPPEAAEVVEVQVTLTTGHEAMMDDSFHGCLMAEAREAPVENPGIRTAMAMAAPEVRVAQGIFTVQTVQVAVPAVHAAR